MKDNFKLKIKLKTYKRFPANIFFEIENIHLLFNQIYSWKEFLIIRDFFMFLAFSSRLCGCQFQCFLFFYSSCVDSSFNVSCIFIQVVWITIFTVDFVYSRFRKRINMGGKLTGLEGIKIFRTFCIAQLSFFLMSRSSHSLLQLL